jgi:hypothetical protein
MQTLCDQLRRCDPTFSHTRLARSLHVERAVVVRYLRSGLTERRADEFACMLGFHPGEVWGDSWWSLGSGAS